MSDRTYVFEPNGSESNVWQAVASMANQKGIDASTILAMRNGNGLFGNNGDLLGLIILFALFGGNGNFGFGGGNGGFNTQYILDTLNRNGVSIDGLAQTMNISKDAIMGGINGLAGQIANLTNQTGMSGMQIINSVQSGNAGVTSMLQSCCCEIKTTINNQGYENRIATIQQTDTLGSKMDANTAAVIAKLDAIEDARKDREINSLTAQLATVNARAERQAELAPLYKAVNDIQCKLPSTATIPYSPVVGIPSCVAYQYGLNALGAYPYANGGQFG